MKLYDAGRAPNCRRVRIFLAEKGVTVPLQHVDIAARDHWTADFTALNPRQRVPILVLDDGTVIAESVAICRYFEELNPKPALFGTGALGRAEVEMWNRRLELELFNAVMAAVRHIHPGMAEREKPQVAEWGEANKDKAIDFLSFLEGELGGREFAAGDAFSIADITGLCAVDFMKPARIDVPEDFANVRRWHAALSARPSAAA